MLLNDHHITYCTNIHPGQDWDTTFKSLKEFVPEIKRQIAPQKKFGIGLRLSNTASEELALGNHLAELSQWLKDEECYVFTMNGFPYGNFHHERVKDQVHAPDWTTPQRLEYTLRLFDQLAYLLPTGMDGGISTSPVSYTHWFTNDSERHDALTTGAQHLAEVALHLYDIEHSSGKYLHLDIEPEPDGLLENTADSLSFFTQYLLPVAGPKVQERLNVPENAAREIILKYITLCYDICHFSLAYEEPDMTLNALAEAGIRIGKIQVSAALKILREAGTLESLWLSLGRFDEPVYLHQVTERIGESVTTYADLPQVLSARKEFTELRAHFHVPIFIERFEQLYSTQDHILKVLEILKEQKVTSHLEVETYTWEVLPGTLKRDLTTSIVRELEWLINRLSL